MKSFSIKFNIELLLFILLIGYTVFINNKSFYYDEPYYLDNIRLLNELGFSKEFLLKMGGPAGPLHAFFFWLVQPLTSNKVFLVRLVNPLFLLITIFYLRKLDHLISPSTADIQSWALGFMFIPMVYVCAGMALTEMPALCMLVFSLYFLIKSDIRGWDYKLFLSAFFLSLAILGRQPYLLLSVPFSIWIWYAHGKKFLKPLVYFTISILLPLVAFFIWKGIAPSKGGDIATKGFISIPNFFLGFGYASLTMLFINRKFFIPLKKCYLGYIVLLIIIITVGCFALNFGQPLMRTTMQKVIPAILFPFYNKAIASVLFLIALYFIISLFYQLEKNRNEKNQVLILICLGIIIASCAKVTHQFSSRYVFQASIFMVLVTPVSKKDKLQILLGVTGAIIGMVSLYAYYLNFK